MKNQYWQGVLTGVTITSLGLVTLLVGSGFQGANMKIGVVDSMAAQDALIKAKNMQEEMVAFRTLRDNAFEFLSRYRLIKKNDAEKFVALSVKATKTEVEKNELEKIKTSVMDAKKKFDDLQLKANPTPEEVKQLDDFRKVQADAQEFLGQMAQDTQNEISVKQNQLAGALRDSYSTVLRDLGKKQGYSVIFDRNVAPFGANDITDDVVKAANALKKP
jgi:Skp family chaperone for outer membrane proteins